jgi:hypothetical protein
MHKRRYKKKLFSIAENPKIIDLNKKNPVAYFNIYPESSGYSDVGIMNLFEKGEYEILKKNILKTEFLETRFISGEKRNIYKVI